MADSIDSLASTGSHDLACRKSHPPGQDLPSLNLTPGLTSPVLDLLGIAPGAPVPLSDL